MDRARIEQEIARTPGILFASLFGSRAGGRPRPASDWDVAIFLDESLDAGARARVRSRLVAALEPSISVDVVLLNDAPPLLARRALAGELIQVNDRRAFVRFFVKTLAAAGDEAFWHDLHARERARRLEEGRFGRP